MHRETIGSKKQGHLKLISNIICDAKMEMQDHKEVWA